MNIEEFVKKYKPKNNNFNFTHEKICTEICKNFWINSRFPCQDGEYCPFKRFFDMCENISELK